MSSLNHEFFGRLLLFEVGFMNLLFLLFHLHLLLLRGTCSLLTLRLGFCSFLLGLALLDDHTGNMEDKTNSGVYGQIVEEITGVKFHDKSDEESVTG